MAQLTGRCLDNLDKAGRTEDAVEVGHHLVGGQVESLHAHAGAECAEQDVLQDERQKRDKHQQQD